MAATAGWAQKAEEFRFSGVLLTVDSLLLNYQIDIIIIDNIVSGYSLTDLNSVNETKTLIEGTYDYKTGKLLFHETKLVYTKSEYEDELCYIHGSCVLGSVGNRTTLNGSFIGKYRNEEQCAKGFIKMVSIAYKSKTLKQKEKAVADTTAIDKSKVKTEPVDFKSTTLTEGDSISYSWKNDYLELIVWDQGMEDGDLIKIVINGKIVLAQHRLTNEKKHISVPLNPGRNVIEILALNVGTMYPNTVTISLKGQSKDYQLRTALNENQKALIIVNR